MTPDQFFNFIIPGSITLTLSGVAYGIIKVGEFNEHKNSMAKAIDNFKDELKAHEERDSDRQTEVMNRIDRLQDTLISTLKNK